jgi:hypothetical protein
MKTRKNAIMAAALSLGIAMLVSPGAQSQPLYDRVIVDMPYTTTVGHKTLPPGEYVIQRLHSPSGSRVLLFYSDNGTKFETSAMTIPVLDMNTARDTKVVLNRIGDDYYYDKVWVQGKEYGYEFILPKEARARRREMMAQVTVPASISTSTITTTTSTTTTDADANLVAEAQIPNEVTEPVQQAEVKVDEHVNADLEARVETPAVAEPEPEVAQAESADREMDQNPAPERTSLPTTYAGWLALMLGGGALLGAGIAVRKQLV